MSPQADYICANGTGAAVRSDINGQLAAIVSNNSGATQPATMYAYQWWADTTTGLLKIRNSANSAWVTLFELDGTLAVSDISLGLGTVGAPSLFFTGDSNTGLFSPGADTLALVTGGTNRVHVTSGGLVGIGSTAPEEKLTVTDGVIRLNSTTSTSKHILFYDTAGIRHVIGSDATAGSNELGIRSEGQIVFGAGSGRSEAARIDSSRRLLVGLSTSRTVLSVTPALQVEGASFDTASMQLTENTNDAQSSYFTFAKSRGTAIGGNTVVQSGDNLGQIRFAGTDGSGPVSSASIAAQVDGTPGANDMPGRLVFSTTVDGASSPTERMRITNSGAVLFTKTVRDFTTEGIVLAQGATSGTDTSFVTNGGTVVTFSRGTNDGTIISLRQDGTEEGTISVSGTTISYNGAHLSRWSQLPGGATREEILRGTVLSNLDEMCGWGDEDNEQLNRMKVSDVEGDKNVSGVFQAWDDDDDTYTDDFYCAMTGDFIIRIAEGVTVERGDLLMSAGDGTAKPQDDDIIRSKTVAKVTSTHVTCTYEDGSYCVPCVLMAC